MKDVGWKARVKTAQHVKSMLGNVISILVLILILNTIEFEMMTRSDADLILIWGRKTVPTP